MKISEKSGVYKEICVKGFSVNLQLNNFSLFKYPVEAFIAWDPKNLGSYIIENWLSRYSVAHPNEINSLFS